MLIRQKTESEKRKNIAFSSFSFLSLFFLNLSYFLLPPPSPPGSFNFCALAFINIFIEWRRDMQVEEKNYKFQQFVLQLRRCVIIFLFIYHRIKVKRTYTSFHAVSKTISTGHLVVINLSQWFSFLPFIFPHREL